MKDVDIVDRLSPIQINKGHDFSGGKTAFRGKASPNEYYAFQVAISGNGLSGKIGFKYNDLKSADSVITADNFFCINLSGIDWLGDSLEKKVVLVDGGSQVLWVSLFIPEKADGVYKGEMILTVGQAEIPLSIELEVSGEVLVDHGDSEPWRFSRLRWLNTYNKTGLDKPIGKYTDLHYNGSIISVLGRKVTLSESGLPKAIFSYFDKNIKLSETRTQVTDMLRLTIHKDNKILVFGNYKTKTLLQNSAKVIIETTADNSIFNYRCRLTAEFDSFMGYELELTAKETANIQDISVTIPYTDECSTYFMGLGHTGGYRPEAVDFKWDRMKRQNGFWMGGINGGLRCEFRGENYYPPLPLLYYKQRTITPPDSYSNNGKGGIRMQNTDTGVDMIAYSGERTVKTSQVLRFDFNLLVTPLKVLDMKSRLSTRYTHGGDIGNIEKAKSVGATHINVHHCTEHNPYINYPFIENKKLKDLIDAAHKEDIGVKVYYTIREQSDHTVELQAFRSLGDEIFMKPVADTETYQWNSEGLKWFAENIGTDIIPAWKSRMDASINLNGRSRFANYWVEGLRWLLEVQDIDGIYIDDTVIERDTMKRARALLEEKCGCLVDLHTCNHYNNSNGFGNNTNMYMELMPYIDTLWIGECFDYNKGPDFWLVEICGTPYGLSGEMLENNGNPYRGMLFGITARYPRGGEALVELWKFIREQKLQDSEFTGFWNDKIPVKCDKKDVYCSLYKFESRLVVAVAGWNQEICDVNLKIEGINTDKYNTFIPEIKHFQEYERLDTLKLTIEPGKGKILIVEL
ncbi:MAG: hypothetical protein A2Y17_01010 [Clostridiales bacterium GWF2_38_85]|nr:MAG: hypothetical protein A2Y17_01010 [Clostridiales bacterium GWF2_38_85]HBL84532.1 hypothetical protein [Clostridiales bacterium]